MNLETIKQEHSFCSACHAFKMGIQIHSPNDLTAICSKIHAAITDGTLIYNAFESDRELNGQASFLSFNPNGPFPYFFRHHFHCSSCGNCFSLFAETFPDSGAKWLFLGNSSMQKLDSDTDDGPEMLLLP